MESFISNLIIGTSGGLDGSPGAQVHSAHIECILHGTERFPVGKQAWLVLLVTVGVEGDTPPVAALGIAEST
jgi:hypothetical protein